MKTLVECRETEPGVLFRLWEEDGRLWTDYHDMHRSKRMDWRKEMRKVNPKIRGGQEGLYGVGYLAPHERVELERQNPRLKDPDPAISQKAWREFWQSSRSEPFRTVDRV